MRSRSEAEALDAADPLAGFRERFVVADRDRIYLDGNSLGRLPVATRERLGALVEQWGEELVGGWETGWLELPRRAGDVIAPLIGAQPGEVVVTDSVTVNLYKLACAVHRGGALVCERGAFPTDRYVLEGLAQQRGVAMRLADGIEDALAEGAGLVVWSHVDYRSAALADVHAVTARCRDAGVPLIWDLSHSAGVVNADLARAGAELAVGCTYKYLNGGPGAPAFLYVTAARQGELRSPIWGWFAQDDQFAMERPYAPRAGVERFLAGTPSILALAAAESGTRLTAEAGIAAIREKSVELTELLVACVPSGVELASPRDPARRGSHVALRHPDAERLCVQLAAEHDVVTDFRHPDIIRLGVAPLYTSFVEVWDAAQRLGALVGGG